MAIQKKKKKNSRIYAQMQSKRKESVTKQKKKIIIINLYTERIRVVNANLLSWDFRIQAQVLDFIFSYVTH